MSQAAFLQSRPGKYLDSDSVRITDEQIFWLSQKQLRYGFSETRKQTMRR